ncbi:MAG: hypothetical protein NC433_13710 [Clostridiales bacterium]|nr:hypothetical protein [Clostridiales bacterium]
MANADNATWTYMLPLEARSRSVENRSGTKLEKTSLSTGVFQGPQVEAYESMPPNDCG